MPFAVTHVLVAIIVADVIRDYTVKNSRKFPLHYVLIAGIAGLLPDIDVPIWWILNNFGYTLAEVHRTFSHTLFIPLIFLALALFTKGIKNKFLGKHKLKLKVKCLYFENRDTSLFKKKCQKKKNKYKS